MANSLKFIAKELGVSVSTVSRVVTGKNYVAPETKKKIMEALDKYNYIPNQVARSLKAQATKTIGIIVPDIRDYFAELIKSTDNILSNNGYSIILADTNEHEDKEEQYLKLMYEKRVDGLILATVAKEHKTLPIFFDNSIPIVFIDNLPHCDYSYDCVLLDNVKASSMAIEHLVSKGHSRIAIIAGVEGETTTFERVSGYRKSLFDHNIKIDSEIIKYCDFSEEAGYQSMIELLDKKSEHDFTAVYVTSFKMSCGAIKALHDKGLECPRDLAFIGFDFRDDTGLITPEISTILQPIRSIGEAVANLLIAKLKEDIKEKNIGQKILLEPILKIAETSEFNKKNVVT